MGDAKIDDFDIFIGIVVDFGLSEKGVDELLRRTKLGSLHCCLIRLRGLIEFGQSDPVADGRAGQQQGNEEPQGE